jgi:hypothetical protein
MREPVILYAGECAYVIRHSDNDYEVVVHSTNHVQHVSAGHLKEGDRAEIVCRRLNTYPRQARAFHGLF